MAKTPKKKTSVEPATVSRTARITPDELRRVLAHGDAVARRDKLRIGPSTALAIVIREGLAAIEARGGLAA